MSPLRRLLLRFRPHRGRLALALGMVALHGLVPGGIVLLIQQVLDTVLIEKSDWGLIAVPVGVVVLYGLNGALGLGRGMLTRQVAWAVITELRRDLFIALLRQGPLWHQERQKGALIARLTNDVNNVQYGVSGVVTAVQRPISLIVLVGAAFAMNPRLAAIGLVLLPALSLPLSRLSRGLRRRSRDNLDTMAQLSAGAAETLAGIRTVATADAAADRLARFDHDNEAHRKAQLDEALARLLPSPVVELVAAVGVAAVIVVGGRQVFAGEVLPGELLAFLVAMGLLHEPLKGLAEVSSLTQRALVGAESAFAVLDAAPSPPDLGVAALPAGPLSVSAEGVTFGYGDGAVLHAVSFHVEPGSVLALVGPSGSGKSTLASLFVRFADPVGGRLLLGGVDLRALPLSTLRRSVSLVTQEPFLFGDTVYANIALGRPEASAAAVEAAARAANAHDFICALPLGYRTPIQELGMRLSGGQRQRICIARALLQDAPVLILDEATSALDAESEAAVQEALERLMAHRTVIAIAHRPSTVRGADQVVVLDQGRVVEAGPPAALLAQGGLYSRLFGA
jgi:subfamily B ATP-binding cassette protein MsbA